MEFSAKTDIAAPLDQVFAKMTDFDQVERLAMRRGVQVTRIDDMDSPGEGMKWRAKVKIRGKARKIEVTLTRLIPQEEVHYHSKIGGLETQTKLEYVALSRSQTRLTVTSLLLPQTLSARLVVQSLKLAKGRIDRRFQKGLDKYGRGLEERLAAGA